MTAGLNIRIDIWTMSQDADDAVGGAVFTGTVSHSNVPARLTLRRPSQLLLQQGLETTKTADLLIQGRNVIINERDEIRVIWPLDHPFLNDRFRIEGVQPSSRRPQFGPKSYTVSRIEEGRKQQ
jgi:hypothetical protein